LSTLDDSNAFWIIPIGTQLSDKDEVLHMEQQSVREILLEDFSFRKVSYERPPLEFADGIQSLPIGISA
jgi:hypothetical protein